MGLKEKDRLEVVKFRLEKSKETFKEIPILIENKFFRTAANRLYYACYYAVSALLIRDGYVTHTHKGVKILFGLHYIKENIIDKSLGRIYDKLFSLRHTGDYEDWVIIEENDINDLLFPAEKFIAEMENLINKMIYDN